jgi:hypothetical protein
MVTLGLVMFSWLCFRMNMDNYPHVSITEDGSLCSTGQHRPGFPRVVYDALRQLGYNGDVPVYRGRTSMAHDQDKCEVNVVIPLNPMESWMETLIGVELDETIEQTAQVALTSLCESHLADTAVMPIMLFPIHDEEGTMMASEAAEEKKRKRAVSGPSRGSSSGALPKYRMIYTPPAGQPHRPPPQFWGNRPQQQQQYNRALPAQQQ